MIEYQEPHSNKRAIIKTIAWVVIFVFLWNQVAYAAGDLFYFKPAPAPVIDETPLKGAETERAISKDEDLEVTNYDLFHYRKKDSGVHKLLPTAQEQEQAGTFTPNYLKSQQSKHEEVIRQKGAIDELVEDLMNRRRRPREEAEVDLKKKKGGPEAQAGGVFDYSLTDPYQQEPHNFNDFINPQNLTEIHKYDITMLNIDQWMAGTEKKEDDDGVSYWLGTGEGHPDEERLIMRIIYSGSGDDKIIDKIYTGFRLTESGEYEAKYRIDYDYSGSDITETRKYDISGGYERLVEKSIYEGTGEDNRLKKTIYYGNDGSIVSRRDFIYDEESGALKEANLYETDSEEEGEGELIQRTVFVGDKNKEVADYSQSLHKGDVTETTVYFYKDGERASGIEGQEYRYSKSKQITYQGDIDTNGDGEISEEELENAKKVSMLVYDDEGRLAGEEVADYMVRFAKDEAIVRTTVYFYEDGKRAKDANYRECLTSAVTYYGNLDKDAEGEEGYGEISDEELAQGIKASETFYHTEYRLKGEEVQDYTVTYLIDGETVKDTTVYFYEGEKRASQSEDENRMEKAVTYWGEAVNEDGTIKEDARKKSETFYQFSPAAKRGEEVADVTLNYYRDGETVRDTTVYFYEGNLRASEATIRIGLERSATYWGNAVLAQELADSDGDGIVDEQDPFPDEVDHDGDGFSDREELEAGSDPNNVSSIPDYTIDTDGDGLTDYYERFYGLDKNNSDSDGDGYTDLEEILLGTNPLRSDSAPSLAEELEDTDNDGIADLVERLMGENLTSENALTKLTQDTDGDGLSDLIEILLGSNKDDSDDEAAVFYLLSKDTDADGITDLVEIITALGLATHDADGDGVADWIEAVMGTDFASAADALAALTNDTDGDSVADFFELLMGTNPDIGSDTPNLALDTNGDGLTDFIETLFLLRLDIDGDGVLDAVEYFIYGDLSSNMTAEGLESDSDQNGVADIIEKILEKYYASKTLEDTDNDGIDDQLEQDLWGTLDNSDFSHDSDNDGIMDIIEYLLYGGLTEAGPGSAVPEQDSDNDGVADWIEILFGSDPYNPDSKPIFGALFTDSDKDGISDAKESSTRDTDNDGTPDRYDVDSDNDGYSDGEEIYNECNPADSASHPAYSNTDSDSNGITDIEEARISAIGGYNLLFDADGDGIPDSIESDTLDYDEDGVVNREDADSDNDGYSDGEEVRYASNLFDDLETPDYPVNYKYVLLAGAALKAQTFFKIDRTATLPYSIADYTLNYARNGVTVRDTTIYFYEDPNGIETDVRASDADREQRKTRVLTYRGDVRSNVIDYDGDGLPDRLESYDDDADNDGYYDAEDASSHEGEGYANDKDWYEATVGIIEPIADIDEDGIKDDAARKSETFYHFDSEDLPGDEVADYTYGYTFDGNTIKDSTIYKYAGDVRASDASVTINTNKEWVVTYINDAVNPDGSLKGDAKKKTETKYYYDDLTPAGDEISDYTYNYIIGTTGIKETVIYWYKKRYDDGQDIRASGVTCETECMGKSVTYIDNALDINEGLIATPLKKSETIYYSKENSLRGDEVAQETYTYNALENITQTTRYYYGNLELAPENPDLGLDEPLTKSATYDHNVPPTLISESFYSTLDENGDWMDIGFKGEELVKQVYRYAHKSDGTPYLASRTDYTYHDDYRVNQTFTYDINARFGIITDPESTELLIQTTTYNYDTTYIYKLLTTTTTGTQHHKQDVNLVSGTYTTTSHYNNFEVVYLSETTGESYNLITDKTVGSYTTTSNYGGFGTLTNQLTVGSSYKYDSLGQQILTGVYTTSSDKDVASSIPGIQQIDEYGVMRESVTDGETYSKYNPGVVTGTYATTATFNEYGIATDSQTIGVSQKLTATGIRQTGSYITNSTYDEYGDLATQVTAGESLWWNQAISDYSVVGSYDTQATIVNGEITLTETTGESLSKRDLVTVTGIYTTITNFDAYGDATDSQTLGISQKMTATGLRQIGRYTTDSTFDAYGDLATQETAGENLWYNGTENITVGRYTTSATIDLGEIVRTDTSGESYSKRDTSVVVGTYTTVTNFDAYGDATDSQTLGISQKMTATGLRQTGRYTTDSTYDAYGILNYQVTQGVTHFAGDVSKITSVYTTTALTFNLDGIVTSSQTAGVSKRNGFTTGLYTTNSTFDDWGDLSTQVTDGITHLSDNTSMVTGKYHTENTIVDGIITESITTGTNERNGGVTGSYTTTSTYDSLYGILTWQETRGESYLLNDPTKVTGTYTTTSQGSDIDEWGIIRYSQTVGETLRGIGNSVGGYTVNSWFNQDGILELQETHGISYLLNDPAKATGYYFTQTEQINSWGIIERTRTEGFSHRGDTSLKTGSYTTDSTFDSDTGILLLQNTQGESFLASDNSVITGTYTTSATIDQWGVVTNTYTNGFSLRGLGNAIGQYYTTSLFT
ncbi:MAG: hypothetical protein WBC74_00075, partial [Candidatus Omnitrophota bacterium]